LKNSGKRKLWYVNQEHEDLTCALKDAC
jgi:hypothetical protein